MINGGHDGELCCHGPDACCPAVEKLTHDEDTNGCARCSEANEQCRTENGEGDHGKGWPFNVAEVADVTELLAGVARGCGESVTYTPTRGAMKDDATEKAFRM